MPFKTRRFVMRTAVMVLATGAMLAGCQRDRAGVGEAMPGGATAVAQMRTHLDRTA